MEVRSDRIEQFALPPEALWSTLIQVDRYRLWWPWLRTLDGAGFEAGAIWDCTVQPPVPYSLRFRITLADVQAGARADATIEGDIVGTARLEVRAAERGSEARLVSHLAPSNRYLRTVARLARPIARFGHDWVLDTGVRQFRDRALPR